MPGIVLSICASCPVLPVEILHHPSPPLHTPEIILVTKALTSPWGIGCNMPPPTGATAQTLSIEMLGYMSGNEPQTSNSGKSVI